MKKSHGANKLLSFADDQYQALEGADALLVATEWGQFRAPDFSIIKQKLKQAVIFDGRNIYEPSIMKRHGFHYESIGRSTVNA